jgi:hypothetical protein
MYGRWMYYDMISQMLYCSAGSIIGSRSGAHGGGGGGGGGNDDCCISDIIFGPVNYSLNTKDDLPDS